jgi:DNA polymerase elongation subunit (family B)
MTVKNYVGAYHDHSTDAIMVWERDENGRTVKAYHAPRYFYVQDENGPYTSIYKDKLKKIVCEDKAEFDNELRKYSKKFESDIPPLFKVLMDEYYDRPTPLVHYAFLDIEVDYKSKLGFSSPENPYAPINAVTIYQSWTNKYLTYAVPPPDWNEDGFDDLIAKLWKEHELGFEQNIVICKNEVELLKHLVNDIQDADVISGWNSEFFDLPYIIKRLERVSPKLIDKMCFRGCKPPKIGEVERFGAKRIIYSLNGRTHLDYLDLFKKFTFEGRTSYSLGNIAADELDIPKLDYEGTLEQLYHRDFAHFIAYNARDVEVLVKLDKKFNFIALVNQMAHENTCLFQNMMGTVRYVETGITNRAHYVHKLIVADKKILTDGEKVEGALVLSPLVGLHDWLGSVDINSLYPSVIRALNISPEKYIGQFAEGEEAWEGVMDKSDKLFILRNDQRETFEMSGKEWHETLLENKWVITPFGTIFDEGTGLGIVPEAIQFWYQERKRLQAEKKKYQQLVKATNDPAEKKRLEVLVEHYDLLQLTKKIQLNSTYGALLSPHFRLGRKEMGASVTACGRKITTFMIEQIGELVTGNKTTVTKHVEVDKDGSVSNVYTSDSPVILLSDTDSCYFKTNATNKEDAIAIADTVAEEVNAMFPAFMRKSFNCQPEYDDLIKAGREIVGSRGIFLNAKKKYTIKVVNLDGFDLNPPKLKTVGSEMKKADTPKVIQDFLKDMMDMILDGGSYEDVESFINSQRGELVRKVKNPISLGVSKQINNLDAKYIEWARVERDSKGKVNLPGHVRAGINYNELVSELDEGATKLKSGDKGIIFYLQPNNYGFKSIAFPADTPRFPPWFNEHFKIDKKLTEQKMIDSKLSRVFEALQWEIPTPQKSFANKLLEF